MNRPRKKTGLHTKLLDHILQYINDSYNYDLRNDEKLKRDLTTHLATLLTRLQFNINTPNPLLNDIKQYYPLLMMSPSMPYAVLVPCFLTQLVKTSLVI